MFRVTISPGVKPIHYDLHFEPNLEECTFKGSSTISIEVTEEISSISLHTYELLIKSTIITNNGKEIVIESLKYDADLQLVEILLGEVVSIGSRLVILQTFTGTSVKDGVGLFITKAHNSAGESKMIASTMLQPTHARTLFPCFDEPALKTTFAITIVADKQYTCISNMPVKTKVWSDMKQIVEFERTPIMSTYLVVFAIGEFNLVENNDFRVPIRIYAPIGYNLEECQYGLDIGHRAFKILEETFETEYPLPKMDFLLLPRNDDAMENWGLITLPAERVLIGEDSTARDKVDTAKVIIHELAHQWFGNLVTVKWWNGLWLNEGFAEWTELYVRSQMSEAWEPWQEFVATDYQKALLLDSRKTSHPIDLMVERPTDIDKLFDVITYNKGCAVVRMIVLYLGEDVFLKGVRHYLRENAYGNTDDGDLWKAFRHVSQFDIEAHIQYWLRNAGYPLVNVKKGLNSYQLRQHRFLISGSDRSMDSENQSNYPIKIHTRTNVDMKEEFFVDGAQSNSTSPSYKLNVDQKSFYRVLYQPTHLELLSQSLDKLSVEDRIGLISDTMALVFSSHSNVRTSDLLDLLQKFEGESNYFVWLTIFNSFQELLKRLLFQNNDLTKALSRFQAQLAKKALAKYGSITENDTLNEQRLKAILFGNSSEDENVVTFAFLMFKEWIEGKVMNPNFRYEVFKIVLRVGGNKQLLRRLPTSSGSERRDILRSLGHASFVMSIKRTLKIAQNSSLFDSQILLETIRNLTTHENGLNILWRLMSLGVDSLDLKKLSSVVEVVLEGLTTRRQWVNAKKLFQGRNIEGFEKIVLDGLEGIEARMRWVERDEEDVRDWLKRNGYYRRSSVISLQRLWKAVLRKFLL